MQVEDKKFFLGTIALMRTLEPDQQPLWGSMTPQHMVEHIVGSWRISNGRAKVKSLLDGEQLEERRAFMFSDAPYPKNLMNPMFLGGLPPLRKASLEEAIDQLEDEMSTFFTYHEQHPGAEEIHPIFGRLDYNGWLTFQTKHMKHHLSQFGLL